MEFKHNVIKRTAKKLKVKTLIDFNGGKIPKGTILELIKSDYNSSWLGGGFAWFIAHLRNGNILEILEQN